MFRFSAFIKYDPPLTTLVPEATGHYSAYYYNSNEKKITNIGTTDKFLENTINDIQILVYAKHISNNELKKK